MKFILFLTLLMAQYVWAKEELKTKNLENKTLESQDSQMPSGMTKEQKDEAVKTINQYKAKQEEQKKILEELENEEP